jgi:hypothetical protein
VRRVKYRDAQSSAWVDAGQPVLEAIRAHVRSARAAKNVDGWTHWRDVVPFGVRMAAFKLAETYPVPTGDCPFTRRD